MHLQKVFLIRYSHINNYPHINNLSQVIFLTCQIDKIKNS